MSLEETLRKRAEGDGPVTLQSSQLRLLLDRIEELTTHSMLLNSVGWEIHSALSDEPWLLVPPVHVDVKAETRKLITRYQSCRDRETLDEST